LTAVVIFFICKLAGYILFATKSQLFEGKLENFSQNGLFIKTSEILTLGEFITVALPYTEKKQNKVPGQILWQNREGYGIELLRKRNGDNIKLLKLEMRSRQMHVFCATGRKIDSGEPKCGSFKHNN
jgi:hypothetical protein